MGEGSERGRLGFVYTLDAPRFSVGVLGHLWWRSLWSSSHPL